MVKDLIPQCQKRFKEIFKPIDEENQQRFNKERMRAEDQG